VVYTTPFADPFLYPFWSLDYFYFSRYYHPFSVLVHRHDPWYYPYPGWYYGFGPRHAGFADAFHYPWYRFGDHYRRYRPWTSGVYLTFGDYRQSQPGRLDPQQMQRVRELDLRLRELETRRSWAIRSQRPDRRLTPGASAWAPATARGDLIRAAELRSLPGGGRGARTERRSLDRQALIERLRGADRGAWQPRSGDVRRGGPALSPPTRQRGPRRGPRVEPTGPTRQRSVSPPPSRSRPQRAPTRSHSRPRRGDPVRERR
jgi:hypothetical protein